MNSHHMPEPTGTSLGKETQYSTHYDASLLHPIPRSLGRNVIGKSDFVGLDIWNLYEVTFRLPSGLPVVAIGRITVPATTEFIVESKSLKLYVGSFTDEVFDSLDAVAQKMSEDLSKLLGGSVSVQLWPLNASPLFEMNEPEGLLLENGDTTNLKFADSDVNPELLKIESEEIVEETLSTNLFRSLCPVTRQPDHATITISYKGKKINHASLLAYLVSFRHHRGFHEQCVETIFTEISELINPEKLKVFARFTRRGGIDICPVRVAGVPYNNEVPRLVRQ